MPRIDGIERRLARALESLAGMHQDGMLPPVLVPLLALTPPKGMSVEVTMRTRDDAGEAHGPNGQRDATPSEIRISFTSPRAADVAEHRSHDPVADVVNVLSDAEQNPQLHFVALKFLRDRLLPQSGLSWAHSPHSCQAVIAEAIERGILTTSKKPNPRNPEFPVTAVQLNREHPVVHRLVGSGAAAGAENGFGHAAGDSM